MKKPIKKLQIIPCDSKSKEAERDMIADMFTLFRRDIYDDCGKEMLMETEASYRHYLIDACMTLIRAYIREKKNPVTYVPGEVELKAMTLQFKEQGLLTTHYKYKADGILKSQKDSNLEILLIEVSNAYNRADSTKVSFDHHKAMFGMLTMIKSIAMKYNKASPNTFKKLKIHFLHAHGEGIRHWSMSVQPNGIYLMTKEQRVEVPVNIFDKDLLLIPFIEFFKTVAVACEATLETLKQLRKEHKRNTDSNNLLLYIHPSVIKINERNHATLFANNAPKSVPSSPRHY